GGSRVHRVARSAIEDRLGVPDLAGLELVDRAGHPLLAERPRGGAAHPAPSEDHDRVLRDPVALALRAAGGEVLLRAGEHQHGRLGEPQGGGPRAPPALAHPRQAARARAWEWGGPPERPAAPARVAPP